MDRISFRANGLNSWKGLLLLSILLFLSIAVPGCESNDRNLPESSESTNLAIEFETVDEYLDYGDGSYKSGEYEQAFMAYTKAIEMDPDSYEAYCGRGCSHMVSGDLDLAIDDLNRSIEINPEYAHGYGIRGIIYHRKGEFELA
ncbi:tetratricopeptide repeat protein, partial [bacterium]|nr:tetratricopeptide repeat protein [bacterium]